MQNHSETILSLVRVARSLDNAGMYQQSDRVHEIIRIASDTSMFGKIIDYFKNLTSQTRIPNLWGENIAQYTTWTRNAEIDRFLDEYATRGTIPSNFTSMILNSPKFRSELLSLLIGRDYLDKIKPDYSDSSALKFNEQFSQMNRESIENSNWNLDPQKLLNQIEEKLKELDKQDDIARDWIKKHGRDAVAETSLRNNNRVREELLRDKIYYLNQRLGFQDLTRGRRLAVGHLLDEIALKLSKDLGKRDEARIKPIVEFLKELRSNGIFIDDNSPLNDIIDKVLPEKGAYLKSRMRALRDLNSPSGSNTRTTPQSASEALEALEKSANLSKENPKANEFPKVPSGSSGSTQQQQQLGKPGQMQRTTGPIKVKFRSPGTGGSIAAKNARDLTNLIEEHPEQWKSFTDMMKNNPKLNIRQLTEALKKFRIGMGLGMKGVVAPPGTRPPSGIIVGDLALAGLDYALFQFGDYLEEPSKFVRDLTNATTMPDNELLTFVVDELLKDSKVSNKLDYFVKHYNERLKTLSKPEQETLLKKLGFQLPAYKVHPGSNKSDMKFDKFMEIGKNLGIK